MKFYFPFSKRIGYVFLWWFTWSFHWCCWWLNVSCFVSNLRKTCQKNIFSACTEWQRSINNAHYNNNNNRKREGSIIVTIITNKIRVSSCRRHHHHRQSFNSWINFKNKKKIHFGFGFGCFGFWFGCLFVWWMNEWMNEKRLINSEWKTTVIPVACLVRSIVFLDN